MKNSKTIKKVREFLDDIDWLFSISNFDREIKIKEQDDGDIIAEFHYEEDYQRLTLTLYPRFFKDPPTEQRKTLLHELCHSLTLPSKQALHDLLNGKLIVGDQIQKINETETSKIENILDRLLQGKLQHAQKAYSNYLK
jgi:hypothetical protein